MSLNLALLLESSAREHPERTALILNDFRLNYTQLNEMANRFAGALHKLGVEPEDKVAIMLPNIPAFTIAYFGILKAGATVVPLNILFKTPEVAYHLEDSDAVVLLVHEDYLPKARPGFNQVETCRHLIVYSPARKTPSDVLNFHTLLEEAAPEFDTVQTNPDDTAVILYTAGTTGRPRGAELTHFNLFFNALLTADRIFHATPDDVFFGALFLFHSFGQTCCQNVAVYSGAAMTLVPRFEPETALRVLERDNVTVFAGVPTMYWKILNCPQLEQFDLARISRNLRLCVTGGAAMPVEQMYAFEEKFGVTILEGYGLSETSPVASFNMPDRPRKPGSIGVPIWGVEMKVVDDEGNELPEFEVGEIVIRGHNVMKGYYKRPEATADVFHSGWFHTGDLAYVDEDGYFFIVGLKKDMILRGGFNVYCREVEDVLSQHPAVAVCAVVGVPHEALGQEVKAYVVLREGYQASERELIQYCKERMAAYKYPRIIEFRDSLPMTADGKVMKAELG